MKDQYTKEQVEDIKKREKEALEYLKNNSLTPAAVVEKQNIGNDIFVDKIICFLKDTKYTENNTKKDEPSKKD